MTTTYPPEPFRIKVLMSLRAAQRRSNPHHDEEKSSQHEIASSWRTPRASRRLGTTPRNDINYLRGTQ